MANTITTMTIEQRILNLENNYIPHKTFHLNTNENIYLGNNENKKCRFCKKSEPDVNFNNIAHAIPEFVNNHRLISYYECDSCNSKFARTLETHMGDYMNVYHTLSQVRGKKGVPSYRKGGEKSAIKRTSNGLQIDHHEGERENFILDEVNKTVTIKAIRATYIPIAIYKCLTKMALTIMDETELENFENTLKWINEEEHSKSEFKINGLKCIFSFTPGPLPHDFTSCLLLKRKNNHTDNVPYMQFLLAYGNFTFQIILPISSMDSASNTFNITPIPTPFDFKNEYGKPKYTVLDFTSTTKVKNEEVSLNMSYEEMAEKNLEDNSDDSLAN
ncbi:HNH endonuclease [Chryseobacterium sp. Marseille-Q8038]